MRTHPNYCRQYGAALMNVSLVIVFSLSGCMELPRNVVGPDAPVPTEQASISSLKPDTTDFVPEEKLSPRELLDRAKKEHDKLDSYITRLRRTECVNDKVSPMSVLHFKYRTEPKSVHFRWIGEHAHGREILWTEEKNDGKLQIRLAAGDMPLARPGTRLSLSPESPLVRSQSPHHISEAGFNIYLDLLDRRLKEDQKDPSKNLVKNLGLRRRKEYPYPLAGVEVVRFAGEEKCLSQDGRHHLYFDTNPNSPSYGLPVISLLYDAGGREVEYHCYDRFLSPVNLDDKDFDPDFLWQR